jgi:hypothetical protein
VYRLTNTEPAGDVQEIARALSTPASWLTGYRVWAYNPGRAILVRSNSPRLARTSAADEIAIIDWLVKQLDQPQATTSVDIARAVVVSGDAEALATA